MQIKIGELWLYQDDRIKCVYKIVDSNYPKGFNINKLHGEVDKLTIKNKNHYGTWKNLGNKENIIKVLYAKNNQDTT